MKFHLQIITAPREGLRRNHLLAHLVGLWGEEGHRITVGAADRLEADLGILHVDRTEVSSDLLPKNPLGRPILNQSVLDISKRRISKHLLGPESDYAGAVMIKTDANAGGGPERSDRSIFHWKRIRRRFNSVFSWRMTREIPWGGYPVLDHLGEVPDWVWRRDDLVVEQFRPEKDGPDYVLRVWCFFGNREYGVRLVGNQPVIKAGRVLRYDYIDSVPDSLRQARAELGVDFGKFDYVLVDGEAILLDVNKTPTLVSTSRSPGRNVRHLASGLADYLESTE
jgi:hypothetical protein